MKKYIEILAEYVEAPLLESLRRAEFFAFYSDETTDVTSTEQLAFYATFEHHGTVKEHFIGVIALSKLVGSFSTKHL